jgi:hypothetical protein
MADKTSPEYAMLPAGTIVKYGSLALPRGFALLTDTCYHLTHYWPAAADIPWRAITQRTMRMPFVIMLERLCKVLCCR